MKNDIKKRLSQMVEINRALADDLDVSRRIVAELGTERDTLRARVEELENEIEIAGSIDIAEETQWKADRIKAELDEQKRKVTELSRELKRAMRGAEAATARASAAEERVGILSAKLCEVEQERDMYRHRSDEAAEAMSEIRYRLAELPRVDLLYDMNL